MLKYHLQAILHLRGVKYPRRFMAELGFNHVTAIRMLRGEQRFVRMEHLEKLCKALRCTPNDLFEWVPDENHAIDRHHPLNTLAGHSEGNSLIEKLHTLTIEELQQFTKNS